MTTEPPAMPDPAPQPDITASPSATTSSLSGMPGETMVMIAGLLVVGVFVIFGLIADEWYPPFGSVVAATFAVIIPLAKVKSVGSLSASTLMTILGYWLAIAGAWDFIGDIRFGWGGAVDVVASLILAAAAVLAFIGARAIKS